VLVVVDTNILLVSVSSRSKYHWLYELILDGRILIALTPGILIEYEEQISKHWNSSIALDVVRSLTELSSSRFVTVYYNLELITADPDDNKFVDCAFASNADFIVSNDNHFAVLKNINFPSIPVLKIDAFNELLKKENVI
jgi:putative PIN family toxin of toxin-antitoxin system